MGLGKLGLKNLLKIALYVINIAKELENKESKIQEPAVGALGGIGDVAILTSSNRIFL